MSITFEPEIAGQMRLKLALDPFPTQERLNKIRDAAIHKYNTGYAALHPETQLANPSALTILNKSSEKATFSFKINSFSQFDWNKVKKHLFSWAIELIILKVIDSIIF